MGKARFTARLVTSAESRGGVYVEFPPAATQALGTRGLVRVRGTVDGVPIRSAAFPTGKGVHYLVLNKGVREAGGLALGDLVRLELEVDERPRRVRVPAELKRALAASAKARAAFDAFPPSHKREVVEYVAEAKQAETRERRAKKTVAWLAAGRRDAW